MSRSEQAFERLRLKMVSEQVAARGIRDERVLAAMRIVPRHLFVPDASREEAYEDHAVPIGLGQTISQPYIVGFMTEALRVGRGARVLEIGTGSGYQTAVLSFVAERVFSVEILPELSECAAKTLAELRIANVELTTGDGYFGWLENAPYDGILVAAAAARVAEPLLQQLNDSARLIAPIGPAHGQTLKAITREKATYREEELLPVSFVPMTGKAELLG
ncbi:MAG: protein-L-isoaspartate(D-aspartate) O-methyltransferase [Nibricoccus sp.]